jgi:hypothetical protein
LAFICGKNTVDLRITLRVELVQDLVPGDRSAAFGNYAWA